jgi:exosortase/archaeosortase family protein
LTLGFAFQSVSGVQRGLTDAVVVSVAIATQWIVSAFGGVIVRDGNVISHGIGGPTVHVTQACDGVGIFLVFASAIFASRVRFLHFCEAVTVGFVAIQAFNLARVVLLFLLRPGSSLVFDLIHIYLLPWLSAVLLIALFLSLAPAPRVFSRGA